MIQEATLKIGRDEVEDIALGAAVLGTGGGGDPFIGKLLALDAIDNHGEVDFLDLNQVDDDDFVIPSAMMGAPTVMVEKVPSGSESLSSLRQLETQIGRKADAIVPIEQGGINSQIPIAVAATLGLPLVDCDGMGRAFPELQMVTFHLDGIPATPMVISDEKGNSMVLSTCNNVWAERIARAVTVQMGGSSLIAIYPMQGSKLKASCVPNSVSLSMKIGRTIRESRRRGENAVNAVASILNGRTLFQGKVVDVMRRTVGGFARGDAKFEGLDEYLGHSLTISFQNENLVALLDGRVVASVPDLITVMDSETGIPITTEGLRYGNRVTVIGSPCSPKWRTPEGLRTVGPRYFGYDLDYVPVERIGETP
jgi:DUF917 family protein